MTATNAKYLNRKPTMMFLVLSIVTILSHNVVQVFGQSNYASHANNINYIGKGLPEETVLDGKVTKLDDISPIIFLNRTKAALNCAAGSMQVDLKFNEKFYGVAYADFDRNSACQIIGHGDLSYHIELPLKGCGTKQDPQRVFTNNIVVRFHPNLEMDGDEIITIVCRYPPPIAPVPPPLIVPQGSEPILADIVHSPLKGPQILFIICALMFLTLLLLGLGVSYYCLRHRTIPVVRRLPLYMGSGSEITKLSGSSLGNLSVFEESVKIPRAQLPVALPQSSSDTLPSDYPSESHSEIEVDIRSLPHSSVSSYENHAYLQEASSVYSENLGHIQEIQAVAVKAPSPQFDVQVRVKRPPPPPPSVSSTSTDTESAISRNDRNNLSTIMESHEDRESIMTIESLPHENIHTQFTYMPELHPAPKYVAPPTVYSTLNKNVQKYQPHWPDDLADGPPITTVEEIETHTVTQTVDQAHPTTTYTTALEIDSLEAPIQVVRKPEITSHVVDDVFLRTITEKRTIEDIEKQKRMVTEYKVRPMIVDPTFDVHIRNHPLDGAGPQWEDFSDISSASGVQPPSQRAPINVPPPQYIDQTGALLRSPEMVGNMKPIEMPEEDKAVPNWDVLIRVLEEPEIEPVSRENRYETSTNILKRQLSYEDKLKWKEIITTESTLRQLLQQATVREDFERISRDVRYERIFEPQSWDVIIRILAPPDDDDVTLRAPKGSKPTKQPWDTRSRRSSLPTLYEYDSDGGSSVRTIRNDLIISQPQPGPSHAMFLPRSRRTSRSSRSGSDFVDIRSMTETTVNFARPDSYVDKMSEGSSIQPRYYDDDRYSDHRSLHRSISHPSLARSESEFIEQWIAPADDVPSSPDASPHMRRTQRVLTTFQPRQTTTATTSASGSSQRVVTSETQYSEQRTMKYQSGENMHWYKQN